MRKNAYCLSLLLTLFFVLPPLQRAYATDRDDLISSLNTLPLLINKISGDVTIALIYNPSDALSQQDAERIKAIVDSGLALPGGGKLAAILVKTDELGKLSRAQLAFLTPGLEASFDDISTATSAASILTFSTGVSCVKAAKCIIGVTTSPTLTVYYSKPAADAAKIEFSQAFSMLVKQP